ncbi:MAG: OsmC family protein [Pseudooceanicola sp.]
MKRSASARWQGNLREGKGEMSVASGLFEGAQYGFNTRFEDGPGTNPEELIGAAHAGCFSMAFANMLAEAGSPADEIATRATVTLDMSDGPKITAIHLDVTGKVPGIAEDDFLATAEKAKSGCPVSQVLNAEITMDAKLA